MNLTLPSKTVSPAKSRRWTEADQQGLFKDYFDRQPGICPVCSRQVGMMMDHKDGVMLLSIRCRGCGNSATVVG